MGGVVKNVLVFFFLVLTLARATETEIRINPENQFQTIQNFGASDCWSMQIIGGWPLALRERIADLLFSKEKGIGLSAWRFNIGAGINHTTIFHPWRTVETFEIDQGQYDWTRQQEERWFLQAAKERGVKQFIAFVNSPPARMTRNGYTNCTDGLGSTNLKEGYEEQFAVYLVDILEHFRDAWDIEFDYISPVNEPEWEWNYGCNQEGNRASNEDIKAIVNALYKKLKERGLKTKISIVECGALPHWYSNVKQMEKKYHEHYGNYLYDLIVADDSISQKIAHHFAGHSYWSDLLYGELIEDRQALSNYFQPFFKEGWEYWMTEYSVLEGPQGNGGHGRDLSINTALDVVRVLHYDLTILNASAWQWWTAVSPENFKDGLIYTDYLINGNKNIIESKLLWALGNYSKFVRPGAKRIEVIGANEKTGLLATAFLSEGEDKIICVISNHGYESRPVKILLEGDQRKYNVKNFSSYITSDKPFENLKPYLDFDYGTVVEIPGRSIITIIAKLEPTHSQYLYSVSDSSRIQLFQNAPNPFHDTTKIYFYVPDNGIVNISIFTLDGKMIKKYQKSVSQKGVYNVSWNGENQNNEVVSSGIYICQVQFGKTADSKKLTYIR